MVAADSTRNVSEDEVADSEDPVPVQRAALLWMLQALWKWQQARLHFQRTREARVLQQSYAVCQRGGLLDRGLENLITEAASQPLNRHTCMEARPVAGVGKGGYVSGC